MICSKTCPRKLNDCEPVSNIIATIGKDLDFVCAGISKKETRSEQKDKFRHCFVNENTDSIYDYDEYDLKSIICVLSESLLIDELNKH